MKPKIKIFDTTLRDGEQTSNVSFSPDEKLIIAENLLSVLKFDRVEIGSCRVSEKELQAIKKISEWAEKNGFIDQVEVLSFTDYNKSIDWLLQTESRKINLLTKGSLKHCQMQLKKTPQEHWHDVEQTLEYAELKGIKYSIYLEDWSRGIQESPDYVWLMIERLSKLNPQSLILCDTMGILNPWKTQELVNDVVDKFPNQNFDFHCHNDYGFAVANSIYAVKSGIDCVHGSINGLGERAGNTNLIEFCVALKDHLGFNGFAEENFALISGIIERFSGKKISHNMPIVGRDVFTQTAGIHADGDNKGDLYKSNLKPERFNRNIEYSLGKMSGRGNLEMNLRNLGIILTAEQKQIVLAKIVEMADAKKVITKDDLPFIIADITGQESEQKIFEVVDFVITSTSGLSPTANIKIKYQDQEYSQSASGNGGYDAFMQALSKIAKKADFMIPKLIDFEVSIPRGGSTNALVETVISWQDGITTSGTMPDQITSCIRATEKAINIFEKKKAYVL